MNLIYPTPLTRINDKWVLTDQYLQETVHAISDEVPLKNFKDTYSEYGYDHQLYQQSFLQVVSETVCNYPAVFLSEKSIKPIVNKRPFVIIGPAGSLLNLQNLGFKTFGQFWDESYDLLDSPEERIVAVANLIENICNYSVSELQDLCIKMSDVLNYNFYHYVNDFKTNELVRFERACIENLKSR